MNSHINNINMCIFNDLCCIAIYVSRRISSRVAFKTIRIPKSLNIHIFIVLYVSCWKKTHLLSTFRNSHINKKDMCIFNDLRSDEIARSRRNASRRVASTHICTPAQRMLL